MSKKKPEFVSTKIAMAKNLELSRVTLDRYLSLPGAPAYAKGRGYDLAKVTDFIAEHAQAESTREKASDSLRALKAREIALRCERLKLRIGQERKMWVKRSDVAGAIHRIIGPARRTLEQKLITEFPSAVAGLDVPQARVYGRRLTDEILEAFLKLGAEFEKL